MPAAGRRAANPDYTTRSRSSVHEPPAARNTTSCAASQPHRPSPAAGLSTAPRAGGQRLRPPQDTCPPPKGSPAGVPTAARPGGSDLRCACVCVPGAAASGPPTPRRPYSSPLPQTPCHEAARASVVTQSQGHAALACLGWPSACLAGAMRNLLLPKGERPIRGTRWVRETCFAMCSAALVRADIVFRRAGAGSRPRGAARNRGGWRPACACARAPAGGAAGRGASRGAGDASMGGGGRPGSRPP
jgi:hypothetical protein